MTTLSADISDVATSWQVSDLPTSEYVRVDSEIVRVKARFEAGQTPPGRAYPNSITVERGTSGTSRASHSSGATLTSVYAVSEGGGTQTVRVLGPFTVDFDDLDGSGQITIDPGLTAGATVLLAWVEASIGWQNGVGGTSGDFTVWLENPVTPYLANYIGASGATPYGAELAPGAIAVQHQIARVGDPPELLTFQSIPVADAWIAGQAEIRLLVV